MLCWPLGHTINGLMANIPDGDVNMKLYGRVLNYIQHICECHIILLLSFFAIPGYPMTCIDNNLLIIIIIHLFRNQVYKFLQRSAQV